MPEIQEQIQDYRCARSWPLEGGALAHTLRCSSDDGASCGWAGAEPALALLGCWGWLLGGHADAVGDSREWRVLWRGGLERRGGGPWRQQLALTPTPTPCLQDKAHNGAGQPLWGERPGGAGRRPPEGAAGGREAGRTAQGPPVSARAGRGGERWGAWPPCGCSQGPVGRSRARVSPAVQPWTGVGLARRCSDVLGWGGLGESTSHPPPIFFPLQSQVRGGPEVSNSLWLVFGGGRFKGGGPTGGLCVPFRTPPSGFWGLSVPREPPPPVSACAGLPCGVWWAPPRVGGQEASPSRLCPLVAPPPAAPP